MKANLKYLRYVLVHKWWVFYAGVRLGGIPIWQLFIHDWSKFGAAEWKPYVDFQPYHGKIETAPEDIKLAFNAAFEHHLSVNPHHWKYWNGVEIPLVYTREMLADWYGAGRAISGKIDVAGWYEKNKANMKLHYNTTMDIDSILIEMKNKRIIPW